ncbi:hypothetical protein OG21DRAFT_289177 [Imleria badia]|nr:hypothetical protein OG21DRAFT_289177 [Imleria badia]
MGTLKEEEWTRDRCSICTRCSILATKSPTELNRSQPINTALRLHSEHHPMESQPPKDFFDKFLVNSAPGQNLGEKAARLFFPDYPNVPGDDDEIPTDSPLMTLLRENLPSMRAASGPIRSQHRKKGKGVQRKGHRSRSDPNSTASKGSHPDDESINDRISELNTQISNMESREDQRIAYNQAKIDYQRWLYTEKFADSQRQREHEMKMEAMKMEMEGKWMEHKKQTMENEIRKLQLEIELHQLKIQELKMKKEEVLRGEGDHN